MVKVVSLKRSATERKAERESLGMPHEATAGDSPEDRGIAVQLEHHHLQKMGVGGALKAGDKVHFTGHGEVEHAESRSDKRGERHSARLRLHRGGVDHESAKSDGDGDSDIKRDLKSSYDSSEKRREEKAKEKA